MRKRSRKKTLSAWTPIGANSRAKWEVDMVKILHFKYSSFYIKKLKRIKEWFETG